MIIQPLREQLIPDVIGLMELGSPYITARTYSDYWLYATLFSSTCPLAVVDDQLAGAVIGFRSQDNPDELYIQDVRLIRTTGARASPEHCSTTYSPGHRPWAAAACI